VATCPDGRREGWVRRSQIPSVWPHRDTARRDWMVWGSRVTYLPILLRRSGGVNDAILPMGNLIQALLPAVILLLWGKIAGIALRFNLTLIIAGNRKWHTLFCTATQHLLCNLRFLIMCMNIHVSRATSSAKSTVWLFFFNKSIDCAFENQLLSFELWLKWIPDSYPNHRGKKTCRVQCF